MFYLHLIIQRYHKCLSKEQFHWDKQLVTPVVQSEATEPLQKKRLQKKDVI